MRSFGCLFFVCSLFLTTPPSPVHGQDFLTNGLVAYYPLDGNANDATGNGNTGIVSNIVFVANRFNIPNSAASFAGSSRSLITLPTTKLNLNPPFSVSVWLKLTNSLSGRILSTAGYELNINSHHAAMNVTDAGNAGTFVQSPNELATGEWHHIVGVWRSNGGLLYTNGLFSGSYSTSLHPNYSRGSVPKIGRNSGSLADSFRGLIDELRVYRRELSADEIQQLHQITPHLLVGLVKAVKPTFSNLIVGTRYQLQVSSDVITWTNQGSPFTAAETSMTQPQYWDVDNWAELFFRLQAVP